MDEQTKARVQFSLGELKAEKVADTGVDAERCLSHEEIERLVEYAQGTNPRVALIVEFLAATGCRITEALTVLTADVRPVGEQYRILVHGKGRKDRKVYIPAELLSRLRQAFPGRKYLFAHAWGKSLLQGVRQYGDSALRSCESRERVLSS